MFVRLILVAAGIAGLTACGSTSNSARVFEKTSESCAAEALANRFVVRFKDGRTQVIEAPSKAEFLAGFVEENWHRIEYAEHDFKVHADVGALTTATTLANNWGVIRIEADSLWTQSVFGNGVTVAVVDSGVDITHSQLAERIAVNAGEQGLDEHGRDRATNGVDDDHDGYIDNVYGYDFVHGRALTGDNNFHGTHVAGIIAASHGDLQAASRTYVEGVAPGAKILPVAFLDENGDGNMADGVLAIEYAVKHGAKVINASWGGTRCSRSLRETVTNLEKAGIVFVVAAGNEAWNIDVVKEYPASLNLPAQITVGATGEQNYMADYSNYGATSVHIFAPGTSIVSTVPGGMGSLSGTSMATPMVAGAAALLLSAEPAATATQIRSALAASAIKRSDYVSASQGRLNLRTALSELRKIMAP